MPAPANQSPKVFHIGHEVYLVPLDPLTNPRARCVMFNPRNGTLSNPRLIGSVVAHVNSNTDWAELPEAEIPPALKAHLAALSVELASDSPKP